MGFAPKKILFFFTGRPRPPVPPRKFKKRKTKIFPILSTNLTERLAELLKEHAPKRTIEARRRLGKSSQVFFPHGQ